MASGTIVVAGDNSGYKEVLNGDGRMSLVDPKQTNEFSRRLELLIDSKNIQKVWKDWAHSEVTKYDFPVIARSYINLYKMAYEKKQKA